ncbi:MAG: aldehyde dehydrogenase [Chitinophagales bacterium]|nr:aldehyde dehydrogenase [Chitinophagales bacterium]
MGDITTISNYIGGQALPPVHGKYLDNIAPATGKVYALIPDSDDEDIAKAVMAAKRAFQQWSGMGAEKRSAIMLKVADLIDEQLEDLAKAESIDSGKPISLARRMDIPRASSNFRFFATAILHTSTESHPTEGIALNYTLRQPLGVVGCISPWNLPLYLFTWKIAPALAAGNCVIAKPSEITPMTAYLLGQLCEKAGMPPGVLNIVHGVGPKAGQAIIEHPETKAISFTGGTQTGKHIARTAAPMFKKLSLELGGKNPNIIFADCDFEEAVDTAVRAAFTNQGQICLCGSRILVEASIYERFKDAFVDKVKDLVMGDPLEESTTMGAVVSQAHQDKILGYIDAAKQLDGRILTGGEKVHLSGRCEGGYFIQPTVIEGLDADCKINMEEVFGPVATLIPFADEGEAIAMANCTEYGLAAMVWTNDLKRAHRVSEALHSGIVWVNCWLLRDLRTPFGGVKNSGVGREGGWEALRFFTEAKNVCIKY